MFTLYFSDVIILESKEKKEKEMRLQHLIRNAQCIILFKAPSKLSILSIYCFPKISCSRSSPVKVERVEKSFVTNLYLEE